MKKILLRGKYGKDKYVLVDDEDFEWLNQWKWHLSINGYVVRNSERDNDYKQKKIYMHRIIMNTPKNMYTDHRNGDKLNNQKNNLRICTNSQNQMNRMSLPTNTSGYRGVSYVKGKIRAAICINGKELFLGLFPDKVRAAKAYDEKAKILYGEFARLNFKE